MICLHMQSFNNTRHDYEITLEPSSIVELCNEEEAGIAKIQYHVRPSSYCSLHMSRIVASHLEYPKDTVAHNGRVKTADVRSVARTPGAAAWEPYW